MKIRQNIKQPAQTDADATTQSVVTAMLLRTPDIGGSSLEANLYIAAFVPCLCNMDERNYRNEGGELHRTKEAKCAADAHFVLSGVFYSPFLIMG